MYFQPGFLSHHQHSWVSFTIASPAHVSFWSQVAVSTLWISKVAPSHVTVYTFPLPILEFGALFYICKIPFYIRDLNPTCKLCALYTSHSEKFFCLHLSSLRPKSSSTFVFRVARHKFIPYWGLFPELKKQNNPKTPHCLLLHIAKCCVLYVITEMMETTWVFKKGYVYPLYFVHVYKGT